MTGPDLYFSFFMFTVDLRPRDEAHREVVIGHLQELAGMGYAGFDVPIAPVDTTDHEAEVESYREFKAALEEAGVGGVGFTTNVAATARFDPTSEDAGVRAAALAYLKSRVDITAVLGGTILAGPIVYPYNVYPAGADGAGLWSNALQDWLPAGYERARPVIAELADYAESQGVRLAIEPVDHWEQPAPNSVGDVLDFAESVGSSQVGVCVDSAHVMLSGGGPESYAEDIARAADGGRLHYVHISAPDRGAVSDSWVPWAEFLGPLVSRYDGPWLLETFNAIEVFCDPLRLTRRKFWVPGEDEADPGTPDAYAVARDAIAAARERLAGALSHAGG